MRVERLIPLTLACAFLWAGSTRPLALFGLHVMVGLACVSCMTMSQDRFGASLRTERLVRAMMWMALPALVCLVPMPVSLSKWLAPGAFASGSAEGISVLSLAPASTVGAFFEWWLACGLVAAVGLWCADPDARHTSERVATWGLGAYVGLAAGHALLGADRILGLIEVQQLADRVLLPLVNPNHVATPILLVLPVVFGRAKDQMGKDSVRAGVALIVVLASLALMIATGSVGASFALLVMVSVAWIRASPRKSRLVRASATLVVALVSLAVVIMQGLISDDWLDSSWWSRIEEAKSYGLIFREHWFAGVGPGAFFQSAGVNSEYMKSLSITDHAHIGVAEWFLETGLVGIIVGVLALFGLPSLGESRQPERAWRWTLGLVGAGVHSLVDFPLQIKAIFLLAITVGAVRLIAYAPLKRGSAHAMRQLLIGLIIAQGLGATWQLHAFFVEREAGFALDFEVDSSRATEAEQRLARLAPWRMEAVLVRMWQQEELGNRDAALEQASGILEMHRGDPDALRFAGYTFMRLNAAEQAQQAFERSVARRPSDYRAWLMLSGLAEQQGRTVEAARAMALAIRHWPSALWPDWWTEAEPLIQGYAMLPVGIWWVEELSDAHGMWSALLGGLLLEEGDPESALLAFEQADSLGPDWVRDRAGSAKALVALDRLEEAEAYLLRNMENGAVYPEFWKELALLRARQGNDDASLQLMQKAILMADNRDQYAGICMHDLAKISSDELGIRLGERLVLVGNGGPIFSTNLALLYYREGRKIDCRRMLDNVEGLMPAGIEETWNYLSMRCTAGP